MRDRIRRIKLNENSAVVSFDDETFEIKFPIGAPPRFQEIWPWIKALDAYDYDHTKMLCDLLYAEIEIPVEVRSALADIISGNRRPNKKAARKLKVAAEKRMDIASAICGLLDSFQTIRHDKVNEDGVLMSVTARYAAEVQKEPGAERRRVDDLARENKKLWAKGLGVSEETVENLARDLRKKIALFPSV